MSGCDKRDQIEKLTDAFKNIDKDNSGFIDLSELENAFGAAFKASGKPVDEAEIKRACTNIMKSVDKDKDNKITLEEYIQYYTSSSLF
jgi:Ca2+-binding EF-hand superfamily protein